MNTAYIYLQLYKLFDNVTPTPVDCGKLCNKSCCNGDDCGMFLFPGEAEVYRLLNPEWINIEKSDFIYEYEGKSYHVPIAFCKGICDRYERPLACRIFPLTPYLKNGKIKIIIDPRAKKLCPLAKAFHMNDFEEKFIKNIEHTFKLLMKNGRFAAFMNEYSSYLDEFGRFFD